MKLSLTDVLDLAGGLLVVAALAVFVAAFSLAGALAVAGVGLLVMSYLIDHPLHPYPWPLRELLVRELLRRRQKGTPS